MVLVLRQHPAEWLTFKRLSFLISLPDCNGDFWAAIAEYRTDLFAIGDDRRVKLRPKTIEDISLKGIETWKVPTRPVQIERKSLSNRPVKSTLATNVGCYCNLEESEILGDLRVGSVPDEALVNQCCWRTICRVRGLNFNAVDPEIWREICQRRGYVQQRENPRGF
jgi:hypothetical protein